jgi:hypothetical protein
LGDAALGFDFFRGDCHLLTDPDACEDFTRFVRRIEMGSLRRDVLVMITTTPMAITLPYLAALEFFELGDPRATKTMDLGRERKTVTMYSQNFIPVQENNGLAKSVYQVSLLS